MDSLLAGLNILSSLLVIAAISLLVFKYVKPFVFDTWTIIAAGFVLLSISLSNVLEQSGITNFFDAYENQIITLFFPIFIFAVYSSAVRQELKKKRELEREREKANTLLSGIFESIPVQLTIYDRTSERLTVNKEVEKVLGWTSIELMKQGLVETIFTIPEEKEKAYKYIGKLDGKWREHIVTTKKGEFRIQRWSRIPLDENISIGIGIDVEEQRKVEKALEAEQRRFELISKSTNDVLYDWDLENDIAWWSRGWETHFGFPYDEIGTNFNWLKTVIHPDDFEALDKHFNQIKNSSHHHWYHEYRLINPAGDIIHVWDKGYFIRDKVGKAIGLVGAMVNITEEKKTSELLQESEEKYKLLFTNGPLPMCIYDPESLKIIEMNVAGQDLYGYSEEEMRDMSVLDVFEEEEHEKVYERIKEYAGKRSPLIEWKHRTKSGKTLTVEVMGNQINYFGNRYRIAIIKDITKRKEAEELLIDSENKYRIIFNESPMPISIFDPETFLFIDANDSALELYEYSREELSRLSLLDVHPKEEIERILLRRDKYKDKAAPSAEWKNITKTGKIIYVEVTTTNIDYLGNKYRIAITKDITKQKEAEEKVFSAFVDGENRERTRLARELHDGIGQYLAATRMNLDAIKKDVQKLSEKDNELFQNAVSYLKQAMTETRSMSHNLMPKVIGDYGIATAIKNLTEDFKKGSVIDITFFENVGKTEFGPKQEINIYRIVQESLGNILKHSQATKVSIQLIKDEFDLILTIEDNGVGFDVNSPSFEAGLGLNGIKTRAFIMGGIFDIETSPEKGTLISVSVPVSKTR